MKIKSVQLGTPVIGIMMDNMKGNTRMVDTKGSEIGLFDEIGSIYSHDIIEVEVVDRWFKVEHTKEQLKLKESVKGYLRKVKP